MTENTDELKTESASYRELLTRHGKPVVLATTSIYAGLGALTNAAYLAHRHVLTVPVFTRIDLPEAESGAVAVSMVMYGLFAIVTASFFYDIGDEQTEP